MGDSELGDSELGDTELGDTARPSAGSAPLTSGTGAGVVGFGWAVGKVFSSLESNLGDRPLL